MSGKNGQESRIVETMTVSRLMPRVEEFEQLVLGAILLEKNAINQVIDILQPASFYDENHRTVYKAVLELHADSRPIDISTVANQLKKTGMLAGVGGPYFITTLTNRIASASNIQYHARIMKEAEAKRDLIMSAHNAIQSAYHEGSDVFQVLDTFQSSINNLTLTMIKGREKTSTKLFAEFTKKLELIAKSQNEGKILGVLTGLTELDRILHGLKDTDLIIAAGRPGMGKTALTKRIIYGAVEYLQRPAAMFSLEMSSGQLIDRIVSQELGVSVQEINEGKITPEQMGELQKIYAKFYDKDGKQLLIIDDTPGLTINELKARAKRINSEHDPALFIVDYLQLLAPTSGNRGNREQDVSEISRGLKALAKEIGKPVIALSQLSRECEKRPDKMPMLADLRDSGAIEQDADVVIFLYRPHYYYEQGNRSFEEIEIDGMMRPSEGIAMVLVAKNRNGRLGTAVVGFDGRCTQFTDLQEMRVKPEQTLMYDGPPITEDEPF